MPTSDKEQIQMIKDWWKQYGTTIVVAVLVFAIVILVGVIGSNIKIGR